MTIEPIDYATELEQIAARAMHLGNPGDCVGAMDGVTIKQAAALILRQAEEVDQLRALLADLEWSAGSYDYFEGCCPDCKKYRDSVHAPNCRLKAALGG